MATFDDRQWMLSLIQNAYVTTDDTGLCEIVIQGNEGKEHVTEFEFFKHSEPLLDENIEPEAISPDITSDSKFSSHRHRSYTERKSERLKREREKASKSRRIHWKHRTRDWTEEELSEMFQRKILISEGDELGELESKQHTSMLSYLIENSQDTQHNAFIEYSKFDGMTHNSVARKQINIYLYNGHDMTSDYPMSINVIASAKVSELIGLICWLYTKENRQPLIKTVDHYQLHIADEDGQCDWDFQPLERRDLIEKYGFTTLALVEKDVPQTRKGIQVTVNFAHGEFSRVEVEDTDTPLREILSKSIRWRKEISKMKEVGIDYHLEKEHEPGVLLDMEKSIADVQCLEFAAVRDNSKRTRNGSELRSCNGPDQTSQSFSALWEKKFSKLDTNIKITGDEIEITPLTNRGGGNSILTSVRSPSAYKYRLDQLIDCHRKASSKRNKSEVVITIQGEHRFKDFKFVCEASIAQELYTKCRALIKDKKHHPPSYRRHNSLSLRKKSEKRFVIATAFRSLK